MLKEDFVIQSNVRRLLIRTDIDCSKIDFGTVKGVVYMQRRFPNFQSSPSDGDEGKTEEITINTLYSLEKKVKEHSRGDRC